ncbi:MAG: AAA family ATPase [Phycisphaerales bacterium]|nr:AAA family ATPase [Phycisphaerales bacterium]
MKTIAIINQKGGVGKTTTVANLGSAIAARGHRLCLIDMDPQAHLTLHVGLEPGQNNPGIYEVLTDNAPVSEAAVKLTDTLSAIPAVIDLAAAETEMVTVVGREQILNDQLAAVKDDYDYVMIDCPPSLGLLTLNALAAADYVFIPLQAHFLALQGLGMLLETVSLVKQRINPRLKVGGVILCMHEKQTRLAGEVVADLEEFLQAARETDVPWADATIFETPIRRNIKLAECPSYGKTIFDYDPYSHGAMDYDGLAEEFMSFFLPNTELVEIVETTAAIEPAETVAPPQVVESQPTETVEPAQVVESQPTSEPTPQAETQSEPVSEPVGEFRSEPKPACEASDETVQPPQPIEISPTPTPAPTPTPTPEQ